MQAKYGVNYLMSLNINLFTYIYGVFTSIRIRRKYDNKTCIFIYLRYNSYHIEQRKRIEINERKTQ